MDMDKEDIINGDLDGGMMGKEHLYGPALISLLCTIMAFTIWFSCPTHHSAMGHIIAGVGQDAGRYRALKHKSMTNAKLVAEAEESAQDAVADGKETVEDTRISLDQVNHAHFMECHAMYGDFSGSCRLSTSCQISNLSFI